jgi:Na+(H+)/acetate symporter ActP
VSLFLSLSLQPSSKHTPPEPKRPALLNSLAGLVSTIASIYGAQHGQFSPTSKATLILTGASSGVFAILTLFYMFWLVRRMKQRHDREVGMQKAGKHGEGYVDPSTRR